MPAGGNPSGSPGHTTVVFAEHVITTVSVDVGNEGDTAVAESCFQFWVDTAAAPVVRNLGRYRDELRRTGDGWRLARRSISFG